MAGLSIGNGLSTGNGLSAGSGFSRGGGLYFSGFSVAPTLNLNFTTMTALPSTITFSRPSNATYYDSTGKLTYAPNNLNSTSSLIAAWTDKSAGVTITSNIPDPDGGTGAFQLDFTTLFESAGKLITFNPGRYIQSVWIKGDINGTILLSDGSGSEWNVSVPVTTSWVRVNTGNISSTGGSRRVSVLRANSLARVYVYSPQFEAVTYQTTPGTYNATTSAAYYGARLDYNPATLAARGLLIEEARTNIHPQSSFQSGYTVGAGTLTANAGTSVDGTSNAASFIPTAVSTQHYVFYGAGVNTTVATYTASVYAKKLGSANYYVNFDPENTSIAQTAVFDLSAGTVLQVGSNMQSASIVDCGNGFYRLIATYTATAGNRNPILYGCTSTSSRVFTGDGASGWLVFGWQVELGSFATSYIPTAASSVARSADNASMTGANFSSFFNATAGTWVANAEGSGDYTTNSFLAYLPNPGNSSHQDLYFNSGGVIGINILAGVFQQAVNAGTPTKGVNFKFAYASTQGDYAASLNGGTVATSTTGSLATGINILYIGNAGSAGYLNGHMASLVYYPQRLPNATLQSLTAPDTAPTGNGLVWGDGNYLIWDTGNFLTWG